MQLRRALALVFASLALAGVAAGQPIRHDPLARPTRIGTPPRAPRTHVETPRGDLATVNIRLERGRCFGTCPDYDVEIRGDGSVVYQGRCFTVRPGRQEARIEPKAVAALVERFRAAEFWSLDDDYVAAITDQPTYILRLSIGGQTKTVADYAGRAVGMPAQVTGLEMAVDAAAGTERWVTGDAGMISDLAKSGFDFTSAEAARMLALAKVRRLDGLVKALEARGAPPSPASAGFSCRL